MFTVTGIGRHLSHVGGEGSQIYKGKKRTELLQQSFNDCGDDSVFSLPAHRRVF